MKSTGIALHRLFSLFVAAVAPHALLGSLEQLPLAPASSLPSPSFMPWPLKKCHITGPSVQTSPPFQVQDKTPSGQAIPTCPLYRRVAAPTFPLILPPLQFSPLPSPIFTPSPSNPLLFSPFFADLGIELAMLGKHCPVGQHP